MSLNRESILAVDDLKREPVEVPEWDGIVWVQELSADASMEYDVWVFENKDNRSVIMKGMNVMAVMLCACDEDGNRLFNADDLDSLRGKAKEPINRIAETAFSLNKMREEDFEDEVKNSESGRIVASISG